MIRITIRRELPDIANVRVEGKVTGNSVPELMNACQKLATEGVRLRLDLTNVNFVDQPGKLMLNQILSGPNELVTCSEFLRAILKNNGPQTTVSRSPHGEDEMLVARLRLGEPEAFEEMVRKFGGRMLATARRYLGCEDDARDALQDAFISAFRSTGSFNGGSTLATWLHRIVINSALMQLRARRRRPTDRIDELLPQFDREGNWRAENWIDERPESFAPPCGWFEKIETRAMVRRCIGRLPDSYRAVLLMRDIEDMETGEVAEALNLTPTAVKVRLHRARQALKVLIERERCVQNVPYVEDAEMPS